MKAAAGASRDQCAAAGLALIFALSGLVITGVLFLPSLVTRTSLRNNTSEEATLASLEGGFLNYVRVYQTIPSHATWANSIALFTSLSTTQINCVFPDFPGDGSAQRVFVIDDYLGGVSPVLPYTQSTNGLTGSQTNLLNVRARAMIVSSTKRGLALPISNGFATQTNFDAVWNWTYNSSTKAAPAGWSSAWTGMGDFLHVKHLYLPSLFSTITFQNTKYGVGLSDAVTTTVNSQTNYYFLNGTPLTLATTTGTLKRDHVVRGDASFNFGSVSVPPIIWFQMEESSGTYATNSGSLGAVAAGTIMGGVGYRQNGPQPPDFPNFSGKNFALDFDSRLEYIPTATGFLSGMKAFTLAVWVSVDAVSSSRTGLVGQNDAIELGFIDSKTVQIWTPNGGSVSASWPYAKSTWHHITATGDGKTLSLYFDGTLAGNTSVSTSNYGTSSSPFCVGGAAVFDPPLSSSVFDGRMDEVIVYDRALSASEVATLATGILP